ncbi:MAG TPA: hypothetical protein VGW40_03395 [Allosphingosinicella sp.]|nr:hypothetical protein [Allosphingosinicella sp.]
MNVASKVRIPASDPTPAPSGLTPAQRRDGGLLRFAIAISVLNILGHLWLGFEQSWATPFIALAAAYGTELAGEWASARFAGRGPRFAGSPAGAARFLLSAHITGLAVGMLLYAAEQLWVVAFAASLAIASKYILRVSFGEDGSTRHFYNPSNFGIAATLILFPMVGIAQPYQFAENISGALDWLLPLIVITTGTLINRKFTQRLPLIGAWLAAFALQAVTRALVHGNPILAGLAPMTGFAFILFTFYMITDPATTPEGRWEQRCFGAAVGLAYALMMELHIVFGLFFALALVSTLRGALLALKAQRWRPLWPFKPAAAQSHAG